MKVVEQGIKGMIAMVGGTIAFVLGGVDFLLKALILFMILDYISGVLKAVHQGRVSSQIGFKGIARKVYLLIIVAVAFVIEKMLGHAFPLRETVIVFFMANEGISILENAVEMDLAVPSKLKNILIQLRLGEEEKDAKIDTTDE